MAAGVRTIRIRFTGDATGLNQASKGASGALKRIGETAAGVFAARVFEAGLAKVQEFVGGSVAAFSNLNESVNAVDKVFGTSAEEIKRWGEQNANSLGLSTRAFNELATPLGAMLKNAGLSLADTTKWTETLTERSADLASVFNTDVSTALEAIQAGLRGESDPLEKFGVSLSAAKVETQALAETGKKAAKDLTDQEKATARLNLIMAQTKDVAGDFRNTSDGLANSQRIAAAKTEELQAKIGEKLAPVVEKLTEFKLKLVGVIADKVVPGLEKISKWISENQTLFLVIAAVIGGALVAAFIAWAVSAGAAAIATIAATFPILAVGAAIGLLIAGIILLFKNWDTIWAKIKSIVGAAKDWIVARFNDLLGWFRSLPEKIGSVFSRISDFVTAPFKAGFNAIARLWNRTVGKLRFTVPSWVPGIGGKGFSMPTLPTFHSGGIVPGPVGRPVPILALAGERVLTRDQQRDVGGDVEVRVFIGDQELRGMVRTEVTRNSKGLKRRALAGAR